MPKKATRDRYAPATPQLIADVLPRYEELHALVKGIGIAMAEKEVDETAPIDKIYHLQYDVEELIKLCRIIATAVQNRGDELKQKARRKRRKKP